MGALRLTKPPFAQLLSSTSSGLNKSDAVEDLATALA